MFKGPGQPVAPLPDGQRAIPLRFGTVKYPDRSGQGGKQFAVLPVQQSANRSRGVIGNDFTALHDHHPVGGVVDVLQAMLRNDDGGAQLQIDLADRIQEIRGRNGVQLAGGLIQDQDFRLHGHDGRQVQQLLLTTGQICHIPVEPILDAKIACHFRHPQPHSLLVTAQAFQPKGQLMPDFIRHNLVVGILHHKADLAGLVPLAHLGQGRAVKQDLPCALAVGCQDGF